MHPNIIGGKYRGRKIPIQEASGLRPTGSRVRETLFSWLQMDISGLATLDLFAGSGLLSFEALSRGAKHSTLIEKNKTAFQALKKNSLFLKDEDIHIHNTDALYFINNNSLNHYDLLFIDPPFNNNLHEEVLLALNTKLSPNTLIYVESPTQINSLPLPSVQLKQKKAGQVYFSLFKVNL